MAQAPGGAEPAERACCGRYGHLRPPFFALERTAHVTMFCPTDKVGYGMKRSKFSDAQAGSAEGTPVFNRKERPVYSSARLI